MDGLTHWYLNIQPNVRTGLNNTLITLLVTSNILYNYNVAVLRNNSLLVEVVLAVR